VCAHEPSLPCVVTSLAAHGILRTEVALRQNTEKKNDYGQFSMVAAAAAYVTCAEWNRHVIFRLSLASNFARIICSHDLFNIAFVNDGSIS
jgi:bifunctional pyridoxal-dependent enzyme with beta-cystathionase and maltose regulon repressor activities